MSLSEKVLKLKREGVIAVRHALSWERMIKEHGEEKTTEFYKSLGLNHLEVKSVEWEGLKLSREPKEHEKLCVKGIAQAQESSKEKITTILLNLRSHLISDGLKGIKKLEPATYHELTLQASSESRQSLRDRLIKVYRQGRLLVAAELGKKAAIDEDEEFGDLDTLTDLTNARIANEVQSRIIAAATRFRLLSLEGVDLINAITSEIEAGSVSYIDRASTGLANRVIGIGRDDEARDRNSEWQRIEYSALLDANCCDPCAAEDGKESEDGDDLEPVPNVNCLGMDMCRCFWVYVAAGEQ